MLECGSEIKKKKEKRKTKKTLYLHCILHVKPIFHQNAKYLASGVGVAPDARILRYPTQKHVSIFCVKPPTPNLNLPNPSQWNIGCVGCLALGLCIWHVHFIFFVLISFASDPVFQWNMGFSFRNLQYLVFSKCVYLPWIIFKQSVCSPFISSGEVELIFFGINIIILHIVSCRLYIQITVCYLQFKAEVYIRKSL